MIWLEIIYDSGTKTILRWTKSNEQKIPILDLKEGEERKFIEVAKEPTNLLSEIKEEISSSGLKTTFKLTSHWAIVKGFKDVERPLEVMRTFKGNEFVFRCYITESLAQLYSEGKLLVGDLVLITFIDGDKTKALAVQKILKTW